MKIESNAINKSNAVEDSELFRQLVDRYTSLGEIRSVVESDLRRLIEWARNKDIETE
jgi:hypothetical protein